jgi:hypothetical protein
MVARMNFRTHIAVIGLGVCPSITLAAEPAALNLRQSLEHPEDTSLDGETSEAMATPEPYLTRGSQVWSLGAAWSDDFDNLTDYQVFINYSTFVRDDVEVIGEFAVRYFDQDGRDAVGFSPAINFRWHFHVAPEKRWSVYADMGIGFMISTDDVPQDGTSFNFTPRIGIGATARLTDVTYAYAGLRWSHISNGRIFGEDDNPSSDGPGIYVGVTMPW